MLNLVIFGPPGAGKGTQSELLIAHYKLHHISTGEVLRAQIASGSDLGQKAQSYMNQGHLVPDDLVISMLRDLMVDTSDIGGYIFDGFPRTVPQAAALDALLAEKGESITVMINLEVPQEVLVERLANRGNESGRADDTPEIIEKRIQEYTLKTAPVANYYDSQGKCQKVIGIGAVEDIFAQITTAVDALAVEGNEELDS